MIKEYKLVFFNYCNVKDSLKWSRNFLSRFIISFIKQFYCTIYALTAAHYALFISFSILFMKDFLTLNFVYIKRLII